MGQKQQQHEKLVFDDFKSCAITKYAKLAVFMKIVKFLKFF